MPTLEFSDVENGLIAIGSVQRLIYYQLRTKTARGVKTSFHQGSVSYRTKTSTKGMTMTQLFHSMTMTQWRWRSYFTQWWWRNADAWVVQSVMRRQCFWRETIGQMLFFLMLFVSLHSPSLHTVKREHSFQHLDFRFCYFGLPPFRRRCYITDDSATTEFQNGACTYRCISKQMHYQTTFSHNGHIEFLWKLHHSVLSGKKTFP